MSIKRINKKSFALACLFIPALAVSFSAQAETEKQWKDGAQVYAKICGHCHETKGAIGPVLAGRGLPVAYIKAIARSGYLAMPAFPASSVDDVSLQEVASFIEAMPAKEAL